MGQSNTKHIQQSGSQLWVHHDRVPGRTRLRSNGILFHPALVSSLNKKLSLNKYIQVISVNPGTGSILVQHERSLSSSEIKSELCDVLAKQRSGENFKNNKAPVDGKDDSSSTDSLRTRYIPPHQQGKVTWLSDLKHQLGIDRVSSEQNLEAKNLPQTALVGSQFDQGGASTGDEHLWHTKSVEDTLAELQSEVQGLTTPEAQQRLQTQGPNILPEPHSRRDVAIFIDQFMNAPVAMLGVSAVISLLLRSRTDAAVIGGVVAINSLIGFFTERKAERTISSLSKIQPSKASVWRDGQAINLSADNIVVGDVIELKPGTQIAADARLINDYRLSSNESALTGESLPVKKKSSPVYDDKQALADRGNMVYMGTTIAGGSGQCVVVATGSETEIGKIQSLAGSAEPPETPVKKQLSDAGTRLALLSSGVCGLVFITGLMRGHPPLLMLKSSISLAVAAVPEGLPAIANSLLAKGIRDMREHNVYARRLDAIENLGAVDVICMDKTGTLTENRMEVVEVISNGEQIRLREDNELADYRFIKDIDPYLLKTISLCNDAKLNHKDNISEGSATEIALLEIAHKAGSHLEALLNMFPRISTKHRSTTHPYMVTMHEDLSAKGLFFVAVKGRPQDVLARCQWEWRSDEQHSGDGSEKTSTARKMALTPERRAEILAFNDKLMVKAYRVLGVAFQEQSNPDVNKTQGLIWLGMTAMADPIRHEVKDLIPKFHQAGIRTIMLTGDQAGTAHAIGRELGLSEGREVQVVEADKLVELDLAEQAKLIDSADVFARVSPSMKLQIVQALQGRGYTVAMTGDGINDGPALKVSDVGIAMGISGTEVAHSMSDIVLQDDKLSNLIHGLREGRTIYTNIQKSIEYLLSTNFSEIQVMLTALLAGLPVPLSASQLLWINLITDVFPSLALGLEAPEKDIMERPPIDKNAGILNNANLKRMFGQSLLITSGSFANYYYASKKYNSVSHANTQAFTALTVAQLLHSYTIKSKDKPLFSKEVPSNPILNAGTSLSLALQAATVVLPPLRRFLGTTPMSLGDGFVAVGGAVVPLLVNELLKEFRQSSGLLSEHNHDAKGAEAIAYR